MYLLVFIQILLRHLAEKILLMKPLNFGGDHPVTRIEDLIRTAKTMPLPRQEGVHLMAKSIRISTGYAGQTLSLMPRQRSNFVRCFIHDTSFFSQTWLYSAASLNARWNPAVRSAIYCMKS